MYAMACSRCQVLNIVLCAHAPRGAVCRDSQIAQCSGAVCRMHGGSCPPISDACLQPQNCLRTRSLAYLCHVIVQKALLVSTKQPAAHCCQAVAGGLV